MLMCAVMVLVAAAPLALATHDVIKGDQGPRASAVTWEYTAPGLGSWSGHIVNTGLRSLVVDVYDNTTGMPDQISHQRIRFAAYDAYPSGIVDSAGVVVAANHVYSITVTPNGPKGSSCTVDDVFKPAEPPVAVITLVSQVDLTVAVSGSLSTDADGTIASYDWDFGDGMSATGVNAVHTYGADGTYTIALTVTDNDGLTDSADAQVTVKGVPPPDGEPVARFTHTESGLTVNVDASTSSDDKGIVSYVWNWGDGTTGTGMTATHTYAKPGGAMASALSGTSRVPGPPHAVFGYTTDASGNPVNGCVVVVKNMRTGESITYDSTREGYDPNSNIYSVDLSELQLIVAPATTSWVFGDILEVTATKGTTMIGTTSAPVTDTPAQFDQIDVVLLPTGGSAIVTVTLTVTDTIGQTASVSWPVTITW
jgi:PKD repeat protein